MIIFSNYHNMRICILSFAVHVEVVRTWL